MKYLRLFILLIVFGLTLLLQVPLVKAACNVTSCSMAGGNCEACSYTLYTNCPGPYCQSSTYPDTCCHIIGSCTICDSNGGCYVNGCPVTGGDPGGGGNNNPTATPTLPPGVTPTATPIPTATPTLPPGVTPTATPIPGLPTATPTPAPGTINAVARVVTTDTSCAAISSSTTGIDATQFGFTASSASRPPSQTQVDNTPVSFTSMPIGSYSISYTLPSSEWTLVTPCVYRNGVLVGYGQSSTLTSGATLEWQFGFTRGAPWVQVDGGDVYASATLRSYIPSVTPRVFNTDGDGGYPGIVTYGTDYDFNSDWATTGNTIVSSTNWLVNATQTRVNYYDYFYRKYGSPTVATTDISFSNLLGVTQPASSVVPYYVVGDMTTTGDWSIGNGESVVIIVNGNATIGGNINIVGNGFFALIVNGTITVSDAVGTTTVSETPVVEGVYIAMKEDGTGGFYTGRSTSALTPRFVGKGMFIADTFGLERDLEGYGVENTGSAAELFIYNPRLLFTMPDEMKENSVTWQEVAP